MFVNVSLRLLKLWYRINRIICVKINMYEWDGIYVYDLL